MSRTPLQDFQRAFELTQLIETAREGGEDEQAAYARKVMQAAESLRPYVVRCLMENWTATGLGHGASGTMADNLQRVIIRATINGTKVKLQYFMPTDASDYFSKKRTNKRSAFVVAASLNYGSVRFTGQWQKRAVYDMIHGEQTGWTKTPVGRKAKATIKKIAYTGKASKRATAALESGYTRKNGTQMTQGIQLGGATFATQGKTGTTVHFGNGAQGVVVTPAKEFWKLTTRQQVYIGERFLEALTK